MVINCIGTDTVAVPKINMLALEYPNTKIVQTKSAGRAVFAVYSQASDLIVIGERITPSIRRALKKTFLEDGHFTLVSETKRFIVIKNGSSKAARAGEMLRDLLLQAGG